MNRRKHLVVTGADSNHSLLLKDFISSFRAAYGFTVDIALINFDKDVAAKETCTLFDHVYEGCFEDVSDKKIYGYFAAYHRIKTHIRDFFPGYSHYCWVDADCWFNNSDSIQRIFDGADTADIAIHPEDSPHYRVTSVPSFRTETIYRVNDGKDFDAMPLNMPMLNAGVFGMRANSPVWDKWDIELRSIKRRYDSGETVYFSDQICLHKIVYLGGHRIAPLQAIDNWLVCESIPRIFTMNDHNKLYVTSPNPPFDEIGILHLAGDAKYIKFKMHDGLETFLTYSAVNNLRASFA
jgi:hypothetical protein